MGKTDAFISLFSYEGHIISCKPFGKYALVGADIGRGFCEVIQIFYIPFPFWGKLMGNIP